MLNQDRTNDVYVKTATMDAHEYLSFRLPAHAHSFIERQQALRVKAVLITPLGPNRWVIDDTLIADGWTEVEHIVRALICVS